MSKFTIEGFAQECKQAMAAATARGEDRQAAASRQLAEVLTEGSPEEMVEVLEAAIPAGADIGEMIVHQSEELTMLYGRLPARFQTGIHNHTVFACICQLTGGERNVFYARDPEAGLRVSGETLTKPGQVLDLGVDVIHHVENPAEAASSALHIYGGDFRAVMDRRSLWSSLGYQEMDFSFPDLMRESAIAMKRDGNTAGLEAMVTAIPAMRELVDALSR